MCSSVKLILLDRGLPAMMAVMRCSAWLHVVLRACVQYDTDHVAVGHKVQICMQLVQLQTMPCTWFAILAT